MPVFESKINKNAPSFAENREGHLKLIEEFRGLEQKIRDNSAKRVELFRKRGQLLPRERLDLLLDRGAPFLQLSTLVGYKMHDDDGDRKMCGGNNFGGIGFIHGVRCMIGVSDSGIQGGAATPMGMKKALRSQEIAMEMKLPFVQLIESAGANLMLQSEMFVEGGRSFANLAKLSSMGIPVRSPWSTAPRRPAAPTCRGCADYVIVVRVRGKPKVFLAGPPLVKAAIGEDRDRRGARRRADALLRTLGHSPSTWPRTTPTASASPATIVSQGSAGTTRLAQVLRPAHDPAQLRGAAATTPRSYCGLVPPDPQDPLGHPRAHRPAWSTARTSSSSRPAWGQRHGVRCHAAIEGHKVRDSWPTPARLIARGLGQGRRSSSSSAARPTLR